MLCHVGALARVLVSPVALSVLTLTSAACYRTPATSDSKIIGGRLADVQPFMVGLLNKGDGIAFCGGSLIAPGIVLTAAHCVADNTSALSVALGVRENKDLYKVTTVPVKAVRAHPGFSPETMQNDVALLFLEDYKPETLPGKVESIALNSDLSLPEASLDGVATVIGWGNSSDYGELFEPQLQQVDVSALSVEACKKTSPSYSIVTEQQICAGNLKQGGVDSCQGDSGGPLVLRGVDGIPKLAGIVSWGDGCAQANKPGVYTRVAAVKPWLEAEIARYAKRGTSVDGDDVRVFIEEHCFTKFHMSSSESDDGNNLKTLSSFVAAGPFIESSSSLKFKPEIAEENRCEFSMGDELYQVELKFAADDSGRSVFDVRKKRPDSSSPEAQSESLNESIWTAPAKALNLRRLVCPETDDSPSLIAGWSHTGKGSVSFNDTRYYISDEHKDPIPAEANIHTCAAAGARARLIQPLGVVSGDKEFILELTNPGETTPLLFNLVAAPKDEPRLMLDFTSKDATSGTLQLTNTTSGDIHTWKLFCSAQMSFIDALGKVYAPQQTYGSYEWKFSAPVSPVATIPAGTSVSLQYTAIVPPFDGESTPYCRINDQLVDIRVNGEKPSAGASAAFLVL